MLDGFWVICPSRLFCRDGRSLPCGDTNPNVQGFVRGAYAAAIGTILGACILLGRIAIGDWRHRPARVPDPATAG